MSLISSRVIPKLYCALYWERILGSSSPNNRMGRNADQSILVPGAGVRIPLKGFGVRVPLWPTNGVLNKPSEIRELPPKGGSAWNCSSTNCSMGVVEQAPPAADGGFAILPGIPGDADARS